MEEKKINARAQNFLKFETLKEQFLNFFLI